MRKYSRQCNNHRTPKYNKKKTTKPHGSHTKGRKDRKHMPDREDRRETITKKTTPEILRWTTYCKAIGWITSKSHQKSKGQKGTKVYTRS